MTGTKGTCGKKDFPEIGQMEILIKARPRQIGYIAERADKQIIALSQKLLSNKSFNTHVKSQYIDFYNQIKSISFKEKTLSYER